MEGEQSVLVHYVGKHSEDEDNTVEQFMVTINDSFNLHSMYSYVPLRNIVVFLRIFFFFFFRTEENERTQNLHLLGIKNRYLH